MTSFVERQAARAGRAVAKSADDAFKTIGLTGADRELFAPLVILLGKSAASQLKSFHRAYNKCLKGELKQGTLVAFRSEMDAITTLTKNSALNAAERERMLAEVYERYQVVAYRMEGVDSYLAEFLRKAADDLPASAIKRAEKTLKQRIAALNAQVARDRAKLLAKMKQGKLTRREAALLRDLRQFQRLVQTSDTDAWRPIMKYLADNGEEMRGIARTMSGRDAARSIQGYRSKVKGLLGEAYSLLSPRWVARRGQHLRDALKAAKRLGPEYSVISVSGTIKLNGKETWDEAILIIKNAGAKGEPPEAILHTAAQTKVERRISAVDQSIRDKLREGGLATYQPSLLEIEGEKAFAFVLRPNPEAVPAFRYLLHAEGGKVSKTAIQRLIDAGISLEKLELDISIEQLDRIADHLIDSTVKVDFAGLVRP